MTEAFGSDVAVVALDLGDAKVETRQGTPAQIYPDNLYWRGLWT